MVYFSLAFEIAKSKLKSSLHKTEKKTEKSRGWLVSRVETQEFAAEKVVLSVSSPQPPRRRFSLRCNNASSSKTNRGPDLFAEELYGF